MTRPSEQEQIVAEAIEKLCELNKDDHDDSISTAINDLQDVKGRLWLAACQAEDAEGVAASRRAWRDETLSTGQMG